MAGKPRADYLLMCYEDAINKYPELKEEIEDDRMFVSCRFKYGRAYCLHCGNTIKLKDVKVGIFSYLRTGLPVPEEDCRYFEGRVLSFCSTDDCDGGPFDWKDSPWPTSRDYEKWMRDQNKKKKC